MIKKGVLLLLLFLIFGETRAQSDYFKSVEQWRTKRIEELKSEEGWLNLIGLFWLKPGKNTFGSDSTVDLIFPKHKIKRQAGIIEWTGKEVWLIPSEKSEITLDGKSFKKQLIYQADSGYAPILVCGSLRFYVIQRGNKMGIRLRDLLSDKVTAFKGIPHFTVDTAWCKRGQFIKANAGSSININNVLGQSNRQPSPGKVYFEHEGKIYTLDVLEGGVDELFILFGDSTNHSSTYHSGRFLYISSPKEDGSVIIDFNKAYSPPCAFTPYATCPLPPPQNILPIYINAGEQYLEK